MSQKKETEKKMTKLLWIKINNAILKCEDVKSLILEFEKTGKLDSVSGHNLVLDVEQLIEMILKPKGQTSIEKDFWWTLKEKFLASDEEENLDPPPSLMEIQNSDESEELSSGLRTSTSRPLQWIDGKVLSENEMLFQEYMNRSFDEESWLNQVKICFDH